MTVRVLVRRLAEQDITDAFDWYVQSAPEYADGLLDEITEVLSRISVTPLIFRLVHGDVRRAALRRYPYFIWFVLSGDSAQVIAVSHKRRNPESVQEHVTTRRE